MTNGPFPCFLAPVLLPSHAMLPSRHVRPSVYAIARKVADIRHYPAGTDKAAAREIRAKEKRITRKRRQKLKESPQGYGTRVGAGIFPYGSPERTRAERDAFHGRIDPAQRNAALQFAGMLSGGQADMLLHTLRARWLERLEKIRYDQPLLLTKDVASLYDSLIDEILLCDNLYYSAVPKPRISDAQYDELVMHLIELERCFPELLQSRSPSQNVAHGAAARATKLALENEIGPEPVSARSSYMATVPVTTKLFPQHRHKALMLSLDNAYNHDDLVAFVKRAHEAGSALSAELKIDGVALSLEYRNRELFLAATRGTGRIGDKITDNVKAALVGRGVPQTIQDTEAPDWVIVRGEVYMTLSDFRVVNAGLSKPLSNPRNAAAGALKHKDPREAKARKLRFIAYECLTGKLEDMKLIDSHGSSTDSLPFTANKWPTQKETLDGLCDWGFGKMVRSTTCKSVHEAEAFAVQVEEERALLDMEADGIVFKFNSSAAREGIGHTTRAPRGALAYKFAAQARVTDVRDVVMQVSRNGTITPVAVLEPVRVGGAILSRATLHNFDEVQRLGVAVGDKVRIERGGDVIPKVLNVEKLSTAQGRQVIRPPERCPSCGGKIARRRERNGCLLLVCLNSESCNAQALGRLIHFASRDAMDIKGLGRKTAEKLVSSGIAVVPADLFRMTLDDILSLEGFAEKSSAALFEGIQEASTSRSLERLINGLGIPTVGRSGARSLALAVESIDGLLDIGKSERGRDVLMGTPNVAEKSATRIHDYLNSEKVLAELAAMRTLIQPFFVVDEQQMDDSREDVASIVDKTFVFTGKFVTMSRPDIIKWIKQSGGRVTSSVSKKTDFVVSGMEPGNKFFKAQRLKVRTVQEAEFFEFFQISHGECEKLLLAKDAREYLKKGT